MSDPANFSELRAAVTVAPPPGAEARVLRRLIANDERQGVRPLRPLVVVVATLVTTTAAALGVTVVPRWVERQRALDAGSHVTAPARTAAPAARRAPRAAGPATPSAAPASPVPAPDLPAPPPSTPGVKAAPAAVPRASSPFAAAPAPAEPASESLLAQQVAAYREASGLVATSPGLAIVRLRAFLERWPTSPLGEEASIRLVQAFGALGRDTDARTQARAFIARYPQSRRRAEMEALVTGAPIER